MNTKLLKRKGEIPFTRYWCKMLNERFFGSIQIIAHVANTRSVEGLPDREIIHKYWHGFLEFKGVATQLEPHQKTMIDRLNSIRPGSAYVARQAQHQMSTLQIEDSNGQMLHTTECPVDLIRWLGHIAR